ncbi:hydrogenase-1 large chain [Salmonella enterica subsp. enterica serovar Enteritidis]|nr:hydrogenase-1 large chain [Salmonella enterica subsp. enterica serovar Enteritidis]
MTNLKNGDLATANTEKWEPASWPQHCRGIGFTEAPSWSVWDTGRQYAIRRLNSISAWSPPPGTPARAILKNRSAPMKAALMGTQMAIPDQPLEILRTLHSFDPCLACSTHVLGDDGSELIAVQVR